MWTVFDHRIEAMPWLRKRIPRMPSQSTLLSCAELKQVERGVILREAISDAGVDVYGSMMNKMNVKIDSFGDANQALAEI